MTLKKIGKYGDIVGGMPLGVGEADWWTKIGQDYMQDVPDSQFATSAKIGDIAGPMPYGYGSPTYGQDIGKPFSVAPNIDTIDTSNNYKYRPGGDIIKGIADITGTDLGVNAPVNPDLLTGNDLRNYWISKGTWTDDNAYINQKLAEWNNNPNNMPTTPEGIAAKLGLTYQPTMATATLDGADVKYEMTPFGGRTAYQSAYDPILEAQQNKLALENARLAALPGLQEQLAGAGERANLAAGEGGKSGMAYEFQRKPLEKFGQQMAQTAGQLEINSLQAQKEDKIAKAKWDMEQDVKEHDWMRGETSKLFGGQYAQDLNDKEWKRNNIAQVAKDNIELAYRSGEISQKEAWRRWSVTNDERLRSLNEARADLEWQRKVAHDNNMFDKEAQLTREMKEIDKEIGRQNQEAADDAAMWGGIGTLVGTGLGIALGGPIGGLLGGKAGGALGGLF